MPGKLLGVRFQCFRMCSHGIQVSKGHSQCHALTLCKVQGKWCWRHVPLSATAVQVGHIGWKWPRVRFLSLCGDLKQNKENMMWQVKPLYIIIYYIYNKMRSKSLDATWWLNLGVVVGVGLGTSIINIDCLCRPLFNQKPLISLMASCMITTAMMNGYGAPEGHTDIPTFTGMMILHVSFHCLPGFLDAWTCFNHGTFFIPNSFCYPCFSTKTWDIVGNLHESGKSKLINSQGTVDHHLPDPLVEHVAISGCHRCAIGHAWFG